jgi:hypothetical protein
VPGTQNLQQITRYANVLSAMGTEPQPRIMAAFETANLSRCVSTVD